MSMIIVHHRPSVVSSLVCTWTRLPKGPRSRTWHSVTTDAFRLGTTRRPQQRHPHSDYHTSATQHKRYGAVPGQGGGNEERYIAQAIRAIRDKSYRVVVEVMNATHVQIAHRYLSVRHIFHNDNAPAIWIRILTHADLLSPAALQYQMQQAVTLKPLGNKRQKGGRHNNTIVTPVMAVSIPSVDNYKAKHVTPMYQLFAGAEVTAWEMWNNQQRQNVHALGASSILVTGLPNAGKSTLIHALTKARTLSVKKKKQFHLPKINATAGWTLGCKSHVFEYGASSHSFSLTDTPGMRPSRERLDATSLAYLVATGSMSLPSQHDFSMGLYTGLSAKQDLVAPVLGILRAGLERHAEIAEETWDASAWDAATANVKTGNLGTLIKQTGLGKYGKLLIEQTDGNNGRRSTTNDNNENAAPPLPNPITPMVWGLNASATQLAQTGKATFGGK